MTAANTVNYDGTATTYSVASCSAATHVFGVFCNKAAAGNTFWRRTDIAGGAGTSGW